MTRLSLSAGSKRSKGSRKIKNCLWIIRKKLGYEQKQVAFLLGHKSTTQLSRYERGARIPNLETALKLEIAYSTPVRVLFSEFFKELYEEVQKKREALYKAIKREKIGEGKSEVEVTNELSD